MSIPKAFAFILRFILATGLLTACSAWATAELLPDLLRMDSGSPVQTISEWEYRRAELLKHLEAEQYGHALEVPPLILKSSRSSLDAGANALLTHLKFGFSGLRGPELLVRQVEPLGAAAKTHVIIITGSCDSKTLRGATPMSNPYCDDLIKDYSTGVSEGIAQGISFSFVQVTRVFPDSAQDYPKALEPWISPTDPNPPGAIIAWASLARAFREYEAKTHPAIRPWVMGFSRYGKAAALSLALDPGFSGGILHMSGSLGTTLSRGNDRETLASIAKNFPHWINGTLRSDPNPEHLSTDQHALIALAAPRPVLIDDGEWDLWSNPALSVQAAELAAKAGTRIYGCLPLIKLQPDNQTPIFEKNQCLVHKYFTQPHSLLAGNWKLILKFVLGPEHLQ